MNLTRKSVDALIAGCVVFLIHQTLPASEPDADGLKFYETRVRPVLVARCYSCHSDGAKKVRGDLKLDRPTAWLAGGSSGAAVLAGKPDQSPLIQAIRRDHAEIAAMPPDKPLTPNEVADLVQWVKLGAPAPTDSMVEAKPRESIESAKARWPFTPIPRAVPVPSVVASRWPTTAIDSFILAKLEAKELKPTTDADRRALIRRATYDLTGLPPTPSDIAKFLADRSPNAFETVLDRLLASPAYGERWGRHWLDVVRYADTAGDNSDFPIPQMVKYRDWVIAAFNADQPYDQFVKEQLAGDLMTSDTEAVRQWRLIATGYLANSRRFGSRIDDYPQHLTIEDTIDNLGRAFLGLTLNCARCHDHKFDPLSMGDYYGIYGIFHSTRYPWPGIELDQRQRDLVPLAPPDDAAKLFADREAARKKLDPEIKALEKERNTTTVQKTKDELTSRIDKLKQKQREIVSAPLPFEMVYAVAEGKTIGDVPIQVKGDPTKPGEVAPRRFLSVLGGNTLERTDRSSGRLALANWITSPTNPLFARVMVNRVWQHHFGRGLVPSPNDFGKQGTNPTHPELLDYLARQFIDGGYQLKPLHKAIMRSRTYQLTSEGTVDGAETADPNNDLLAKYRVRRLDAESIRDTLLVLGGNLDTTPPTPHPFPPASSWKYTQHNPFRAVYNTRRRSVYLMTQRIQRHPYLAIFDGADTSASTGSRANSTTALQSLYFLNDQFFHAQAALIAAKLQADAPTDAGRISLAYERLFARPPSAAEQSRGVAYLAQLQHEFDTKTAWESYTRSLLRLNEFVYLP